MTVGTPARAASSGRMAALGRILSDSAMLQAGAWLGGVFQENANAEIRPPLSTEGFVSHVSDVPTPDWPFGNTGSATDAALHSFVDAGVLHSQDGALRPTEGGRGILAAIQLIHQRDGERIWDRFPWLSEVTKGRRVLDAGCGNGAYSLMFRDFGARSVLAVDYSPARVRTTLQLADASGGGVLPIRGSVEGLPLTDNSIDLVFSRVVIPYVHQGRTLGEFARVLARGGRAMLILHAARFYWGQLRRFGFRPGLVGERARAILGLAGGAASAWVGAEPKWKLRRIGFRLSYQARGAFSRLAERCGLRVDAWEPNGDKPIACLSKPA